MTKKRLGAILGLVCGLCLAVHAAPAKAALLTTGTGPGLPFGGTVCADVPGASLTGGIKVQAFACNGSQNQVWSLEDYTVYGLGDQRCLDVYGGATTAGSKVDSAICNGTGAQQWYYIGGQLVNIRSGLCLDSTNMDNGTQLVVNPCSTTGLLSQQWQFK